MKIFKNFFIYPIQFIIFLKFYYFLRILPNSFASNFGGTIFKILRPLFRANQTSIRNLKMVFSNNSIENILMKNKKSWENLGRTTAEFAHLDKITSKNSKYITIKGDKYLKTIASQREQVIFIGIHLANWEILAPIICNFGIKITSVYRHINNPLINNFILEIRKKVYKSSNSLLTPKGKKSAQDMITAIRKGYSIALMIDQKDNTGISVPFLNTNAKTQTGFLKLSKKFNLKIYPVENKRVNNTNFEITIHKPIKLEIKKEDLDPVKEMSEIYRIVGNWIINQPENWLWQHNRWN